MRGVPEGSSKKRIGLCFSLAAHKIGRGAHGHNDSTEVHPIASSS